MAKATGVTSARDDFSTKIERYINGMAITQSELAHHMGYDNPNIITMFKRGTTRVPLEKVGILAEHLGVDPGELLREWLKAYMPAAFPVLEKYLGALLSGFEPQWLDGLRATFDGRLPPYDNRMGPLVRDALASLSKTA